MTVFKGLAPEPVWRHFASLCAIPRLSRHEAEVRRHIAAWASGRGLDVAEDPAGNLRIRTAASPGREGRAGIVLQAHLDMVGEAAAGSTHDFTRDPIRPFVADGWVSAHDTTLGADNGIGVALALAALEDQTLAHPPLEVLLTVDEETGMGGAHGLAPGWLSGRRLLNLDTETWGEVFLGCAGGCDVDVSRTFTPDPAPDGASHWRITLGGLIGGHSGCDIHLGRGNANKLLVRTLLALAERTSCRLAAWSGGSARNAIPRDAWAEIALPAEAATGLEAFLALQRAELAAGLRSDEAGISLSARPVAPRPVLSAADQAAVLETLAAAPCGVRRMSDACPGVVETSNNLGVVRLEEGAFAANLMVRSLRDAETQTLAGEIAGLFRAAGCAVRIGGVYPGWSPRPDSPLLALCREVYAREFGVAVRLQVIHAGLECGLIGSTYPGIDMISFGPTIVGPHAPGERVEIESVARAWRLLQALLAAV